MAMRPLIVTGFITLDGFYDDPMWTFKDVETDEAIYDIKGREEAETDTLVLGRKSYDDFAPVWPEMEEFEKYNAIPKYVVSSTLTDPEWNNTSVLGSLDDVAQLKEAEGRTIAVHGSIELAQSLLAAGLVDRYHLLVGPLLQGSGRRLFADDTDKTKLKLTEHAAYSNGVQLNVFEVVK
jgi:dihydrofolate reductase